jgi:hypothetical protein
MYLITQYHILEVRNLNSHCHENLKLIISETNLARAKFKVLTAVTMKDAVLTWYDDGGSRFL